MQLRIVFAMSSCFSIFITLYRWHIFLVFYAMTLNFLSACIWQKTVSPQFWWSLRCTCFVLLCVSCKRLPWRRKKANTILNRRKRKNCVVYGKRRLVENFRWVRSLTRCLRIRIKYRVLLSFLSPETRGRNLPHLWYYSPV